MPRQFGNGPCRDFVDTEAEADAEAEAVPTDQPEGRYAENPITLDWVLWLICAWESSVLWLMSFYTKQLGRLAELLYIGHCSDDKDTWD